MSTTTLSLPEAIYQQLISQALGMATQIPQTYNFAVFLRDLAAFPSRTWRHNVRDPTARRRGSR